MKIALVNTLYPPTRVGGAERSVAVLAEGLAEKGYEVEVIALTGDSPTTERIGGVTVHRIAAGNLYWPFGEASHRPLQRLRWHLADSGHADNEAEVVARIERIAPDIVHTNNLTGFGSGLVPACARLGLPVIHTLRDFSLVCARASLFRNQMDCATRCTLCRLLTARRMQAIGGVGMVVGNSSYMIDRHRQEGLFRKTPSRVIFNAVPGLDPARVAGRSRPPRSGKYRFGYVGAIKPEKGIETLLAALDTLGPDGWTLTVAGTGASGYANLLKRRYAHLPIDWLGFVPVEDVLDRIDGMVIPSVWPEPMPRTLIEAMAHGLPVIASDAGGTGEVARLYAPARLYPRRDGRALSGLLREAITASQVTAAPSAEALERFTVDTLVSGYIDAYQAVIGNHEQRELTNA